MKNYLPTEGTKSKPPVKMISDVVQKLPYNHKLIAANIARINMPSGKPRKTPTIAESTCIA